MKHASLFLSLLCVFVFTGYGQTGDHLPFETSTVDLAADERPSPADLGQDHGVLSYENAELGFTFSYPTGWVVEERQGRPVETSHQLRDRERHLPLDKDALPQPDYSDVMVFQILLRSPSRSTTTITVFSRPDDLDEWLLGIADSGTIQEDRVPVGQPNAFINGMDGYTWRTSEPEVDDAVVVVVIGNDHVYQVAIPTHLAGDIQINRFIHSIRVGGIEGPTVLPDGFLGNRGAQHPGVPSDPISMLANACTNCGETDTYKNSYSCCSTTYGNCTWKTEERRPGDDNFIFGGTGRDAYRWMTLANTYTKARYAQGGTTPQIGSVLVTSDDYGTVGHVATVTSIGSNGSVTVIEQNCSFSCTRQKTYDATFLRSYLAGYIYTGSTAPTPTAKAIATSGETIVDDYNFSNIYNFATYGPGCTMDFNGGQRAWGRSSAGLNGYLHYIRSKASPYTNYGRWRVSFQQSGNYELRAWIPNSSFAGATTLKYEVNGSLSASIDQTRTRGQWVQLRNPATLTGYWAFSGGNSYNIFVTDSSASTSGQWIALDALKFIRK